MAESRDESKMASSTPASVARSRGSGGRRGSSSSSRSSTPSKSKTSAERKKRKQRKPAAVDEAGSKDAQPPREADGKPSTQQPAGAPVEVRQGTPARARPDQRRDVTPDLTVAKTPTSQQPLDSQREVTHGLIVPWVPLAEPPNLSRDDVTHDSVPPKASTTPMPPGEATHESILRRTSLSGPSQLPCDDVHEFIAQVAPRAAEEVNVPTASKWSLRRPTRVFNIRQKIGRGSKETFCKLLLIGVPALVIGVALAKHFSKVKVPPGVAFCSTEDCTKFGLELRAAINSVADPCTDFHSFVCGGWDDPKRQWSTEARMMAAAADLAIAEAKADIGHSSKATQFFHSCDTASVRRVENLQEFAELRRSLGLIWPEQMPNGSAHPLDVMVDLAINWEMNFLFDMSAVPVRESVALLFARGRLDASWEQSVQYAWPLYEYEDYVKKYYGILGVAEEGVHLQAAELLKLERAILLAKVAFLYDAPRQRWFKLSDMDSQTKTTSAALWLSFLTTHDKQFSWTADSTVITEDVHIFRMIDKLMREFNHDQLIVGLSWIFIQSHLWAVYGEPSIRFRGPPEMLMRFKRRGCMDYVDSRLGLLSLSKTINDRYGSSENRLQVVSFLYRINENVKRLLKNLTWMDEDSKRVAYLKLEKMIEVVMPNDSFFERRNLEELYSVFPRMAGKTFVTNMVKASEVYRRLRNHEHFEDVYSIRASPRYGREMYLYLPNLLKLAFVDLFPPLFFKNATLAIIYGGLGSFAARQMAKSFDDVGVTVDHKGQSGIWLGPNAAAVHAEKASCNVRASSYGGEWRPLRLFPVVAGLEIAYQSYLAAVSSDYLALEDFRVKHLEMFTDDQVFFLTYCYALCSKRLQTMGDECNVPLKNSKRFAKAFGCPEKSRMNPRTKCTFFDP